MSESDISTLINEEAIKRTKRLIQLFKDNPIQIAGET